MESSTIDARRGLRTFMGFQYFHRFSLIACWLDGWMAGCLTGYRAGQVAELLGLLGLLGSVLFLGFVGRRLEPCSLPRSTLGEVGGLTCAVSLFLISV